MFVDDNQEQTVLPLQSLDCSGTASKTHDVIEANGGVGNASSMLRPRIIQVTSLICTYCISNVAIRAKLFVFYFEKIKFWDFKLRSYCYAPDFI